MQCSGATFNGMLTQGNEKLRTRWKILESALFVSFLNFYYIFNQLGYRFSWSSVVKLPKSVFYYLVTL